MSRVTVRSFIAWGDNCEDPLVEAVHHGPGSGPAPLGASSLVRTVAGASLAAGVAMAGTCASILCRAGRRGVAASLLWWWLLVYALLQTSVLPSRVAVAFNLPPEAWANHAAAAVGEFMYAWLIFGVAVRLYGDPCAGFPELRDAVGWVLLLSFVRSSGVDLYQLWARRQLPRARAPCARQSQGRGHGAACMAMSDLLIKKRHRCDDCADNPSLNAGCAICLMDFEEGAKLIQLPCRHAFHSKCIRKWLKQSNRCPLCMCDVPDAHKEHNS